jgi:hypothetical protein
MNEEQIGDARRKFEHSYRKFSSFTLFVVSFPENAFDRSRQKFDVSNMVVHNDIFSDNIHLNENTTDANFTPLLHITQDVPSL